MSEAPPRYPRLHLRAGRERSVRQRHPWIFSGAVDRLEGMGGATPPVVEVIAADGARLGRGLYSPDSQIRVRLLAGPDEVSDEAFDEAVDEAFFAARLQEALHLRQALLPPDTTGYRLVNAEGDGLPGWTVDRYGDVLVSQVTAAGLEALRGPAYAALGRLIPEAAILQSNDLPARRLEKLDRKDEVISGEVPEVAAFIECGFTFEAELQGGQKTGFYCDQRDNRRRVEEFAAGRAVLDLFAHTGAFGLYALRGGAASVVGVESAPRLIERGRRHMARNGFGEDAEGRVEWVRADVFEDLRQRQGRYDLVICDPPPLVRQRSQVDAGARAYKDLNRLALQRLSPGGLLLTFSCSAAVDGKLFRQILFAAAAEAGVRLALLAPLSAAPDHPVSVYHPQGEYLKGWLARVAG